MTPVGWFTSESFAAHVVGREDDHDGNDTREQVVRKLTQADRLLGEGLDIADVCRELQVSEQTYYRWRNQFGGLRPMTLSGSRIWSVKTRP